MRVDQATGQARWHSDVLGHRLAADAASNNENGVSPSLAVGAAKGDWARNRAPVGPLGQRINAGDLRGGAGLSGACTVGIVVSSTGQPPSPRSVSSFWILPRGHQRFQGLAETAV